MEFRLLQLLGREAPIIPAAAWISSNDVLRLSFAEKVQPSNFQTDEGCDLLVNKVMIEISKLLPPSRRFRKILK